MAPHHRVTAFPHIKPELGYIHTDALIFNDQCDFTPINTLRNEAQNNRWIVAIVYDTSVIIPIRKWFQISINQNYVSLPHSENKLQVLSAASLCVKKYKEDGDIYATDFSAFFQGFRFEALLYFDVNMALATLVMGTNIKPEIPCVTSVLLFHLSNGADCVV